MSYPQQATYAPQSGEAALLPPLDTDHAKAWIQSVWSAYVELFPKILGLQHEAAELSASTGAGIVHDTARSVVAGCAELLRIHARVQATVERYAAALGMGGVVVTSLALLFAAVAVVILWSFRRYDALRDTLDGVQAGQLTPEQARELLDAAGPTPDLSAIGGFGLGALAAFGALAALWWYLRRERGRELVDNPTLAVLGANPQPSGVWSRRVLELDYVHDDDGQAYRHTFRPGVRMQALEDGSVRLYHPRRRIWEEF